VMTDTSIDSITSTGLVSTGSISGMSVGSTDSGSSITAAGLGTINNLKIGKLGGTVNAKKDNMPGSGTLTNGTINNLTPTGVVNAFTASNLAISTVGGTVNVTGTLTSFTLGTVLGTATLTSGHFGIVTALHVSVPVKFIEGPITRTVSLTPHIPGGVVPDSSVYYDGTAGGNPRATVKINAAAQGNFDLGVTTSTATGSGPGFDLAGLFSSSQTGTGIHNVVVGGNVLLGAVTPGAIGFLGAPANATGGVQLPQDVVAVAAAGNLPAGSIVAKSVPAVAAGSFAGVSADTAGASAAASSLATGTKLSPASDTFLVFLSEASHVAQFLVTGGTSSFDSKSMLFADIVNDNAPVTVADVLVAYAGSSSVTSVTFSGQGGSLTTAQPISLSISAVAGSSIGNLILSAPHGISANITADRILGNIDATIGPISGVVETTVGDFGRALTDASGNIIGVTYIHAGGGGLTGEILAKGNLVSQVNLQSGLAGVVAADGDIGVIQTKGGRAVLKPDGSLIRFGGVAVSTGGLNGLVIARGNVFGDINVTGGLSGRIAAKGDPGELGLAPFRYGILGNVSISGGISTTGAVVSSGLIGDDGTNNKTQDAQGTHLSISGNDKGILAAGEDINFGSTGSLNTAGLFEFASGANLNAINYIFTNMGTLLDVIDPTQLNSILKDLLGLNVSNGMLTGTTP
jgi:hypothetical protein